MQENSSGNQGPGSVQSGESAPFVFNRQTKPASKPTYIEESQLQTTQPVSSGPISGNTGKSRIVFWVGIGLLILALLVFGVYMTVNIY